MTRMADHHTDVVLGAVRAMNRAATSPLAASWRRSAVQHRLDPAAAPRRERIDGPALDRLREAGAPLLAAAGAVLDQLFRTVGRSGCGVFLSEASGVVLDCRVTAGDARAFAAVGLAEGGRWGEAEEGTNGIGTCLFEGQPVTIHRDQHFSSRNIGMSCMDAPIHDPEGRLVAALDVSSCRDDHAAATGELVAGLVRDAARRIERDYFCARFRDARVILLADEGSAGTALLAADRDDIVVGASHAARMRLNLGAGVLREPRPVGQVLGSAASSTFEDGDRAVLRQALARADGNASAAARLLGIGRATLYRRMARAGLRH